MPHNAMEDRENFAIWITGIPGVGLNSVGEGLDGFMTDHIGYRSSHLNPDEWSISYDVLRYKMTDPERENPYYYGFGQNYGAIASLPWKYIIILVASPEVLSERIITYRKEHNIEGDHEAKVEESIQAEKLMINELRKLSDVYFVNADEPVEVIIQAIKSRKWTKEEELPNEDEFEDLKYQPGVGWYRPT
jgi:broad-specificity NMP kinase